MASRPMGTARLEAFSDGVIAIIITIMVLDLKVPHDTNPQTLWSLWPVFLSYALSYFLVAIYWLNHHYLFSLVEVVDTRILWANMLLLFCISLIPFSTAFMGENHLDAFSTAIYAATTLICGLAFLALRWAVSSQQSDAPEIATMHRWADVKNLTATGLYLLAIPAAYIQPALSLGLTFVVALLYFDPRVFVEKNPLGPHPHG